MIFLLSGLPHNYPLRFVVYNLYHSEAANFFCYFYFAIIQNNGKIFRQICRSVIPLILLAICKIKLTHFERVTVKSTFILQLAQNQSVVSQVSQFHTTHVLNQDRRAKTVTTRDKIYQYQSASIKHVKIFKIALQFYSMFTKYGKSSRAMFWTPLM